MHVIEERPAVIRFVVLGKSSYISDCLLPATEHKHIDRVLASCEHGLVICDHGRVAPSSLWRLAFYDFRLGPSSPQISVKSAVASHSGRLKRSIGVEDSQSVDAACARCGVPCLPCLTSEYNDSTRRWYEQSAVTSDVGLAAARVLDVCSEAAYSGLEQELVVTNSAKGTGKIQRADCLNGA